MDLKIEKEINQLSEKLNYLIDLKEKTENGIEVFSKTNLVELNKNLENIFNQKDIIPLDINKTLINILTKILYLKFQIKIRMKFLKLKKYFS